MMLNFLLSYPSWISKAVQLIYSGKLMSKSYRNYWQDKDNKTSLTDHLLQCEAFMQLKSVSVSTINEVLCCASHTFLLVEHNSSDG